MPRENKNRAPIVLELDIIVSRIAELAVSSPGRERIESLIFYQDRKALKEELERVTEMKNLLQFDDPFPLKSFKDLRPLLRRAEVAGSFLDPDQFLAIKHLLVIIRQVKDFFKERAGKYKICEKMTRGIKPLSAIEKEISRVVGADSHIKDKASETLFRLRQSLKRKESRVRSSLKSSLRGLISKGYAQEDSLVLREGRLVLSVKEEHRQKVKGVVVDQSASGATVFIEPIEALEINNEVMQLKVRERNEVENILKQLTNMIREQMQEIEDNFKIAGVLDCLMARGRFSIEIDGNAAFIPEDRIMELKKACHPILLMRKSREGVVPLSLRLGGETRTLVITGPNAGGKTVALKTAGLLAIMHQHGLHVPAAQGTSLPVFSGIFADIGDMQSIENDLSTFSSHVINVVDILDTADENGLVLLDEIGSATDPVEGAALAEVVLRELTRRGCLVMATTHMGNLKIFAHEESGVANGSMVFDQETLKPTYQFQMGIPGSSYAFEIAARLGLKGDIIEEAKSQMGEERGTMDRLISQLEGELQRAHALLEDAEIKESKLSGLMKLYEERIEQLGEEGEVRKQEILDEAQAVLREANTAAERIVQELREKRATRESIKEAKKTINEKKERVRVLSGVSKDREARPLSDGDRVSWPGHEGRGEIISDPDRSGRVLVDWNGLRLRIHGNELRAAEDPQSKKKNTGIVNYQIQHEISDEIDLRGMTADEAISTVEKYLSDAVIAGISSVRVIHGKGTGVLRREIGKFLKGHSLIQNMRLGSWNEGDTGVTVVELK